MGKKNISAVKAKDNSPMMKSFIEWVVLNVDSDIEGQEVEATRDNVFGYFENGKLISFVDPNIGGLFEAYRESWESCTAHQKSQH